VSSKTDKAKTRAHFAWQEIVAARRDLSLTVRLAAWVLALHRNVKSSRCDLSYAGLAQGMGGVSERTAIRVAAVLEDAGLITIIRGGGRGHRNQFTFILPPTNSDSQLSPFVDRNSDTRVSPFADGNSDKSHPTRVTNSAINSDRALSPEHVEHEEHGRRAHARAGPPSNFQTSKGKKGAAASLRPEPIPLNWQPSADDLAYATNKALTPGEIERAIERFRIYNVGKHINPSGAWRDWVQRDAERKRERSGQPTPAGSNGSYFAVQPGSLELAAWAAHCEQQGKMPFALQEAIKLRRPWTAPCRWPQELDERSDTTMGTDCTDRQQSLSASTST
jgi:hypothetical protein